MDQNQQNDRFVGLASIWGPSPRPLFSNKDIDRYFDEMAAVPLESLQNRFDFRYLYNQSSTSSPMSVSSLGYASGGESSASSQPTDLAQDLDQGMSMFGRNIWSPGYGGTRFDTYTPPSSQEQQRLSSIWSPDKSWPNFESPTSRKTFDPIASSANKSWASVARPNMAMLESISPIPCQTPFKSPMSMLESPMLFSPVSNCPTPPIKIRKASPPIHCVQNSVEAKDQKIKRDASRKSWDHCAFCKANGETAMIYKSHLLRDTITGKVTCPVLRKFNCVLCNNGGGDDAHTAKYCPKRKELESCGIEVDVPRRICQKSDRTANGRRVLMREHI